MSERKARNVHAVHTDYLITSKSRTFQSRNPCCVASRVLSADQPPDRLKCERLINKSIMHGGLVESMVGPTRTWCAAERNTDVGKNDRRGRAPREERPKRNGRKAGK